MTDADGHWVTVRLEDGTTRQDWIPDAQPAAPDGDRGSWHVVRDHAAAEPRWEWHPTMLAVVPPTADVAPEQAPEDPTPEAPDASTPLSTLRTWRWPVAAGLAAALVVAIILGTTRGGGSDDPTDLAAGASDQPIGGGSTPAVDADTTPRDITNLTTDGTTGKTIATTNGSTPGRSNSGAKPQPTPLTWQQQVATNPSAVPRLNPLASDWNVEKLIIAKDLAGKFLGRIDVRYSGPGSAIGKFEIAIVKDGKVITTLVGQVEGEVRSGVYPVILQSSAPYVDGPWTTQFRVVATS